MLTTHIMHVHVPRTGGTTLQDILKGKAVGYTGPWPYPYKGMEVVRIFQRDRASYTFTGHWPYDTLVRVCEDAGCEVPPAFIFVRNPFDWHVSRWHWIVANSKDISFERYLMIARSHKGALAGHSWVGLGALWDYLGGDKVQYIGRFEHFADEVIRILMAIIPDLIALRAWKEPVRHKVLNDAIYRSVTPAEGWLREKLTRRERQTKHNHYCEYYTFKTRAWVEEMDWDFLERFDYRFNVAY